MLKISFDLDVDIDSIREELQKQLDSANKRMIQETYQKGIELASSKLKRGSKMWLQGFSLSKDEYVLTLSGMPAKWIEDGAEVGEMSKYILNHGKTAKTGKNGSTYKDIPLTDLKASKDSVQHIKYNKSDKKITHTVDIKRFKSADDFASAYSSTGKAKRVQDIIQNVDTGGKAAYVTIKRISSKGKPWPRTPMKKADIFGDLEKFVVQNFDRIIDEAFKG